MNAYPVRELSKTQLKVVTAQSNTSQSVLGNALHCLEEIGSLLRQLLQVKVLRKVAL